MRGSRSNRAFVDSDEALKSPPPKRNTNKRAAGPFKWSHRHIVSLIDNFMKVHKAQEKGIANGQLLLEFGKFWDRVKAPTAANYTVEEACRKFCALKKEMRMASKLADLEGFDWTWEAGGYVVSGDEQAWEDLAVVAPELATLKGKRSEFFEEMTKCTGNSEEYSNLPHDVAYPPTLAAEKDRLAQQDEDDNIIAGVRASALAQLRAQRSNAAAFRPVEEAWGAMQKEMTEREEETYLAALLAAEDERLRLDSARIAALEQERLRLQVEAEQATADASHAAQLRRQLAEQEARDAAAGIMRRKRSHEGIDTSIMKRPRTDFQTLVNLLTSVKVTSDAERSTLVQARHYLADERTLTQRGKANAFKLFGQVDIDMATAYVQMCGDRVWGDETRSTLLKGYFEEYVKHGGKLQGGENEEALKTNFAAMGGMGAGNV